jgi:ribosomal-protein-alanine N-acetyltransferase
MLMGLIIETKRLILRPFELADAPVVKALCGDIEIAQTTLLIPHPYPDGAAESWIITSQEAAIFGTRYTFAITDIINSALYGCITLNVDKLHKRGELSYWMGKDYWNQGYTTEAALNVIKLGFETIKLQRIWGAAMTKNPGSIQVMCNAGMQYEGTFRQHILKWDNFEDIAFYGMIKSEFISNTFLK